MAELGEGDGTAVEVVISQTLGEQVEQDEQPLLVAMQPGIDVPTVEIQEVVVLTDGNEGNQSDLHHAAHVDSSTGHVVAVAAVEEVNDESEGNSRQVMVSDIKAPTGRLARPRKESSSSESDSDASSSEDDDGRASNKRTPKKREFAHRLQWRNKDMLEAMKSVEEKKMTIRGAAKKFAVPYSTLKDRVHGRVRHGTKPGVKTALSPEEEEELVKYVKDMESAGFQMKCVDVRDRAGELLRLNHGHNSPYKEGSPGHNWLAGFLKRHPDIEFKRSVTRHIIPSMAKQKTMVKKFFEIAGSIFRRHRLHTKSDRLFVVSECRVKFFPEATILLGASADGTVVPPFVVFRGQRVKVNAARQVYPEAFFTCSYTGRVNEDIFLWWFRDHFLKKVPSSGNRPLVLFLSRPVTDISLQLAQLAKEERVMLVSIPPGVAHLLQPLDDEMTRNLETMIAKRSKKWQDENNGQALSIKVLAEIIKKVWRKGLTLEEITRKFSNNGLYPLNPNAITMDRMLTATQFIRDAVQQSPSTPTSGGSSPIHLHGLSLLSALSSHEYASMEHIYDGQEGKSYEDGAENQSDRPDSELSNEVTPPPPPAKRRRYSSRHDDGPAMSYEVINTPEAVIPRRRRRSLEDPGPDVKTEIVQARDNVEQINRAIHSILEQAGQAETGQADAETSSRTTPRNRQNYRVIKVQPVKSETYPAEQTITFSSTDLDKLQVDKLEQGEVVQEEVVEEELVGESLKEEYVSVPMSADGTVQELVTTVSPDGTIHQELMTVAADYSHQELPNADGSIQEFVPVSEDGQVQQFDEGQVQQFDEGQVEQYEEGQVQQFDEGQVQQFVEMVEEEVVQEEPQDGATGEHYVEIPYTGHYSTVESDTVNSVSVTPQSQQLTFGNEMNSVETLYINGQQVKIIRAQPNLIQQLRQQGINVQVEHVPPQSEVVETDSQQDYIAIDNSQFVLGDNEVVTEEQSELIQECVVQDSYILDDGSVQEVVLEEQVY